MWQGVRRRKGTPAFRDAAHEDQCYLHRLSSSCGERKSKYIHQEFISQRRPFAWNVPLDKHLFDTDVGSKSGICAAAFFVPLPHWERKYGPSCQVSCKSSAQCCVAILWSEACVWMPESMAVDTYKSGLGLLSQVQSIGTIVVEDWDKCSAAEDWDDCSTAEDWDNCPSAEDCNDCSIVEDCDDCPVVEDWDSCLSVENKDDCPSAEDWYNRQVQRIGTIFQI